MIALQDILTKCTQETSNKVSSVVYLAHAFTDYALIQYEYLNSLFIVNFYYLYSC